MDVRLNNVVLPFRKNSFLHKLDNFSYQVRILGHSMQRTADGEMRRDAHFLKALRKRNSGFLVRSNMTAGVQPL